MPAKIVVAGSFVYDLVVWLPYFPRKGETLLASDFNMNAGGKGFNQAVAARRFGAEVSMLGKVGRDQFGSAFIDIMHREGIDHTFVIHDETLATSLGIPMIDPQGENSIIGIPLANTHVTPEDIRAASTYITEHQVLLLQNEIPLPASLEAARISHQAGMAVIFNPAPASHLLQSFLPRDGSGEPLVDWFTPNEVEANMLTGMQVTNDEDAIACAKMILAQGVGRGVVVTLGSNGVVAATHDRQYRIQPFPVTPVDPTGAGDAFCGAFAAALAEGIDIENSLMIANAAGALAVMKPGAEPSLPNRTAIRAFLYEHGKGDIL